MLASGQITAVDAVTIVLSEPNDMPASVIVHWVLKPSVIAPERFPDVAAVVVKLFAEAHVALAAIRRGDGCKRQLPDRKGSEENDQE